MAMIDDTLDNIPWFHKLDIDDKLQLLRQPLADVPEELAERLERESDVIEWRWEDDDKRAKLVPAISTPLREQRTQLYSWWHRLAEEDRAYIIEHREGRFDEEWREEVESASGPVLRVAVQQDGFDDNRFELTPMLRVYVEHQARALRAKEEEKDKEEERPPRPAVRTRPSGTDSAMMPDSHRPQYPPPPPPLPDMFR